MSIKSFALSFVFFLSVSFSFAGTGLDVLPADPCTDVIVMADEVDECSLSGTFTSGGISVEVTVTADDCAGAAAGLQAVARAIDSME